MRISMAWITTVALSGLVASSADQNPAVNAPDKFAWQLFLEINKSAGNGTRDRVWETWATHDDVYGDPKNPPKFPGAVSRPKQLRRSRQLEVFRSMAMTAAPLATGPHPAFLPLDPESQEVRMNRPTVDFIAANQLWYLEGQVAAFRKGAPLNFPIESKEIKASWKRIVEAEKQKYHWQVASDGNTYGLIALHIMTKDIPNWFWATFEQVDNPNRCREIGCRDQFGVDAQGKLTPALTQLMDAAQLGPEWRNYRLSGSQVDFVDSTGRPLVVGNSEIETPFMTTSSCMSCHARATVDGLGGRLSIFVNSNPLQGNVGAPIPSWFQQETASGSKLRFLQLDFVWSFLFAQPRGN